MLGFRLHQALTVAATGLLLGGLLGSPAQATPASVAPPVGYPTNPRSLVNDPTTDSAVGDTDQHSVTIAVAGPNVVAAYNDSGSGGGATGYSVSVDGGDSWLDQGALYDGPLSEFGNPSLAVDELSGRVYLATEGGTGQSRNLLVHRSDDDGLSFAPPVIATGYDDRYSAPWLPNLAVDNFPGPGRGTVYLGWTNLFGPSSGQGIRIGASTNGGDSFTPSRGVAVAETIRETRVDLVVTPDHCVHVVYLKYGFFDPDQIAVRTSCDGGQTLGPEMVVATPSLSSYGDLGLNGQFNTAPYPQAAVNPVTGALYLVYADNRAGRGSEVLLTTSTDGGATWSPARRVGSDPTGRDQFSPGLAVADNGRQLMVTFYDRRDDPINLDLARWGQRGLIDTATNRVSLLPDFALSPSFRPPNCCDTNGRTFFSGYEEIAADGDRFNAAWTDNRDGDAFSAYQPDIRAAAIPTGAATDLRVSVTGSPGSAVPLGAEYSYTATVTNVSTHPAANVIARTVLPLGTRFESATSPGGICYRLGRAVSCGLGSLPAGASRTVTVRAQALANGPLARTVTATTSTAESTVGNNTGNAAATVKGPAVEATTYSTGDIAVRIPEQGGDTAIVPLDIAAAEGIALDIDVVFRAQHANVQEIGIVLLDPDGRVVPLSTNNAFSTQKNYGTGPNDCSGNPTVFDDAANQSIIDAPTFFQGRYHPEGTLSDLAGEDYNGTWRLRITDPTGSYIGTVGCFQLRITHRT